MTFAVCIPCNSINDPHRQPIVDFLIELGWTDAAKIVAGHKDNKIEQLLLPCALKLLDLNREREAKKLLKLGVNYVKIKSYH